MQSFIDASSAGTGPEATSWMAPKLSGIVSTYVGACLPDIAHSLPSPIACQAEKCFLEMDSVLDGVRAAPSTAEMDEKASVAPGTAGDTASWWYCPYSESLIQVDPVVVALHGNLLPLSPLYDDWHIDGFVDDKSSPHAPVMGSSFFTDLDDESHPLTPGADPSIFAYGESSRSSSPFVDAPLETYDDRDDKNPPLWTAMDPFLFAFGEVHHFLSPAAHPPLFHLDEPRRAPAPEMDPSLFTDHIDDENHPLTPAINPSLFFFSEAHHASAPAINSPLFTFEEAHHAPLPSTYLHTFPYDEETCINTVPQQRMLRGAAMKDFTEDSILAQAQRSVLADEPFELEAFIVASRRKSEETKMRWEEEVYDEGNYMYIARSIIEVFEDVAERVEDLLAEILPDWLNPTSGLIERAEECFHDSDLMPLRPSGDRRNPHSDRLHERDEFDDSRVEGNGWLFCVPKNRFVQQDPTRVCIDNAVVGRRAATSSPSSQTEHNHDARGDIYDDHSPVDAILAADYALYVAEHMQLALYESLEFYLPAAAAARLTRHIAELDDEHSVLEAVFETFFTRDKQEAERVVLYEPLESYLPAAAAARLTRHIAELDDEHTALEAVFERFFAQDKQEEERVAIETQMIEKLTTETRIMIQMQNLLSGGGEKKLQEEGEALAPVCHATECYAFVPIDDATIKQCDALVGFLRAPQIDECAPLETLRGNDHHASSRSDCHLYLPSLSFCYTPGSMVDNDSFLNGADTSFINASGPHCIVPKFDRQPTAEERLFALLGTVGAAAHRRLQGISASGVLLIVGCVVSFLGVICVVAELTCPKEEEIHMTATELHQTIAAAVAEGIRDREETLREEFRLELDLLRIAGGVLQAAAAETFWTQEVPNELEHSSEIKNEAESSSSFGKKKKTHRAGRKHKKSSRASEDGLGGGGAGVAKGGGYGGAGEV